MLHDRNIKIVNHSLNTKEIEEADHREEEERQAELERVQRKEAQLLYDMQSISRVGVADLSSFSLSFLSLNNMPLRLPKSF
jgi:hypothetical protein